MKKLSLFAILVAFVFASCTKTDVIHESEIQQLPADPLSINLGRVIFSPDEITVEQYNTSMYDSCRNENVLFTGTAILKLKQSPDLTPYYILYEIDLRKVTGIGEITGTVYRGGGRIINFVYVDNRRSIGVVRYKAKYHSANGNQIIFSQKALFIQTTKKVVIDINSGFIETCK